MTDSSQDGIDNTRLRVSFFKKAFRVETILFMMALPFIAIMSNKFWTNEPKNSPISNMDANGLPQRELQDAMTSLQEIQDTISVLRETQAALQEEIEATKGQINDKKIEEVKEQVVAPLEKSSSRNRKPPSAVKDFPIFETSEWKARPMRNDTLIDLSPRKMQTVAVPVESANDTGCDGTLFRLELALDEFPFETVVTLNNEETGELLDNLTFFDEDPLTDVTFEKCLDKGAYVVRIFDTHADGLACFDSFDGFPCYNIFIDNELAIPGAPFQTSLREHSFDSNSLCITNDVVIYTLNFDSQSLKTSHVVRKGKQKDRIEFFDLPGQSEDQESSSFYSCLTPSIFDLIIKPRKRDLECDGPCFTISVNNETIVEGPASMSADNLATFSFFITIDRIGREQLCRKNPLISPINELSEFGFDDRIARVLNVIQALSKMQDIFTRGTPQYKATCYILYDDPLVIKAEERVLAQRYALAVFIFSTNQRAEIQLPLDMCFNSKFECNEFGDIVSVDWSGEGLNGIIPTEIGHLTFLQTLRLDMKDLMGTIPTEIDRLQDLQILSLDHNKLTGTIPPVIGTLPLRTLSLWDNKLRGTIPPELGGISNLAELMLHENELTGSIPKEIFRDNGSGPNNLVINANKLTGTIPTEIGIDTSLQIFYTENNRHTGPIPSELGALDLLWMIDLGNNALTGSIPTEIANISLILSEVRFNDNFLTGTLPVLQPHDILYLNNNTITGPIPASIFNLSISGLKVNDNDLTGAVTQEFCDNLSFVEGFDNVYDLWVDDSPWFIDRPLVSCPCCDDVNCHLWNREDIIIVGGTRKPSCPTSNSFTKDIFERFIIIDDVAKVTHGEGIGKGIAGPLDLCLSPTGCFSLKHEVEDGRGDGELTWDREYRVVYSNTSRKLEEKDICDAIEICGEVIGPEDPRRVGFNHLTHVLLSDLSILDRPDLPDYQALCWLMKDDTLYENYSVCDGTLLQRYVMALLYYTYKISLGFQKLEPLDTCFWTGVTCDPKGRFVEELDLSGQGLKGHFVTELGLLTRLRKINLSDNELFGIIDNKIFEYLPILDTFDVSTNKFGGQIPRGLLILPKIEEIDLSNNLLVGEMPHNLDYSQSIKKFNVENNLLIGFIPSKFIDVMQLEYIGLAKNNFRGAIDSRFGLLSNLKELHLNQNSLSGSIPSELFDLSNLEKIELQSNGLTGSIPTVIGLIKNATVIALNHNFLKGPIPLQMSELTKLQYLQLHVNLLTGTAPFLPHLRAMGEDNRYITDCGSPFHHISTAITCPTCTTCCNSDEMCQVNLIWNIDIVYVGFIVTFAVPLGLGLLCLLVYKGFRVKDNRDPLSIFDEDSSYALVFSDSKFAYFIFLVTFFVQGLFYYTFLLASSFEDVSSDWQFTLICPNTSAVCKDSNTVSKFGWFLFFVVTIATLGVDYVNSALQLRKSMALLDPWLFVSGFLHMGMTVLALFASGFYNQALATSNTELIVNAVILLFINDLDEQFMNIFQVLAPDWIDQRIEEVRKNMASRREDDSRKASTLIVRDVPEGVSP